ncbi:DNA/RNA polymerase [Microstroma glucosiphilum]|uniref:DNA/RNA polymerase n=1 Tax=Pseudomicrostroma glucosiphilum TaxID=1684307 RepID=A0A316UC36_9BASI|nr:DNA/RNA polymerase [Pseudomicrostroma glucosiphilum]PWN22756.1 DNA/RNA polymerase [Pseudomicrostroma glucosiphilum]
MQQQSAASSAPVSPFFRLDKDDPTIGIAYDPTLPPGHVLPILTSSEVSEEVAIARRRLLLASHLASHLRSCILHEIGLTASAGIASNKLLAKLMCAKHKPAEQTVFLPANQTEVQQYLDTYEVRALNGFGGAIVNKLRGCLGGEQLGHSGTEWINGGLGLDPQTALVEARDRDPPVPLTVSLSRKAFTAQSLVELFGQRLGPRLWGLLHGIDHDEVIPAPLYPHQISIEDTFRGLRGQAQHEQLHVLSSSLLRRLEVELVEDEGDLSQPLTLRNEPVTLPSEEGREQPLDLKGMCVRSYVEEDSLSQEVASRRTWRRYPLSVRLSIRQGWENRTSKQTRMPVEVFDLSLSRSQRATALAATLEGLRRSMIATHGDRGEGINLINIAALDLVKQKPAASIGALFANGNGKGKGKEVVIDEEFLRSLPPEIRKEVMDQYGHVPTDITAASADEKYSGVGDVIEPNDEDVHNGGEEEEELICDKCGAVQEAWLQHDHLIWPVFGLPPCFAQLMDKNLWSGSTWADDQREREKASVLPPSQERH